jgi:uroporphyrinogen decarboxylase
MTSRERVLTAINHKEPDRVPIHADFTPEAAEKLSRHLKLWNSTAEAYSGKVSELPLVMGHDILVAWHGIATSYYAREEEEYTCEWGIGWRWVDIPHGRYTEMVKRPLSNGNQLSSFSCPDPHESWRYDSARTLLAGHGSTHAIVGGMPCTLFEAAWYLRGYEEFLADLMVNKDFAHALLDKISAFQLVTGKILAGLGVDILWLGDDFGTQNSLIVSPDTWREFFKPRYAALIQEFRAIKPDVKIAYHSDGNIESLLPEYIEIGVDILNAVQPKSMDPARLKRRFGKNLSFWGTIDIQEVMPYGAPKDVEEEVMLRIRTVGPGGGLILGPSHNIQPDVPLENILAFYDAAKKYGKYPIRTVLL